MTPDFEAFFDSVDAEFFIIEAKLQSLEEQQDTFALTQLEAFQRILSQKESLAKQLEQLRTEASADDREAFRNATRAWHQLQADISKFQQSSRIV